MINVSLLVALLLSILSRIGATWQSTLSRSQLWSQQPVCSSVHCWRSPLLRGWVRRRTRTQQSTEEWIEIDVWSANVLPGLRAHWVVHMCSWRTFKQSGSLIVLNILRHNELKLKVKRGPMQCAIVGSSLKFLRYHLIILVTAIYKPSLLSIIQRWIKGGNKKQIKYDTIQLKSLHFAHILWPAKVPFI